MTRKELTRRLTVRGTRQPMLRALRELAEQVDTDVWLVGGAVRDVAAGRTMKDIDLSVTRRLPALLDAIQRRYGHRGFRFRKRGVTTWRVRLEDQEIDIVDACRRGLNADLQRRDFTINAMAFDLRNRRLADPLNGCGDLRRRRLRACSDRSFRDDPLRALRLARFAAAFPDFRIDTATRQAASDVSSLARRVSVERVRDELDKLLITKAPHRGMRLVEELGLLDRLLPELTPMRDYVAGRDRPDVWEHTMLTLEASTRPRLVGRAALRDRPDGLRLVRWSLLLHDISKPETFARAEGGKPTFHGHEVLGAKRADAELRRLRVATKDRQRIVRLIRLHLRPGHLGDADCPRRGMIRLARDAGSDLALLCYHAACDAFGSGGPADRPRWRRLGRALRQLPDVGAQLRQQPSEPLLSGDAIMKLTGEAPGPQIGRWMRRIAELRDEGELTTAKQATAWVRAQSDA